MTAATRKFKVGRNYRDKWPRKKRRPRTGVQTGHMPYYRSQNKKKVFVILKWLWKGEWSLLQQSILNFMPAAPFKSLKKTLIQVSVAFLKWPFMIHVTVLQWWLEPLRWRGVETKGWISAVAASLQNDLSGHCGWGGVGWQEEELFSVQCSCGKKAWGLWVWLKLESVESWEACWLVEWFGRTL